jgi:hypothetical protein
MMVTVFEGIPEIFIERYDALFQQWGREFRRRGRKVAFAFDLMPDEVRSLDEAGREVLTGAWLLAEPDGQWMVIRPATEWDRHLIDVHCTQLRRWMLQ